MPFEWDHAKAQQNLSRHGLSFEEAATIFDDPSILSLPDDFHSEEEDRNLSFGLSQAGRLLAMAWTLRGDTIRIISARSATPREQTRYEQGEDHPSPPRRLRRARRARRPGDRHRRNPRAD